VSVGLTNDVQLAPKRTRGDRLSSGVLLRGSPGTFSCDLGGVLDHRAAVVELFWRGFLAVGVSLSIAFALLLLGTFSCDLDVVSEHVGAVFEFCLWLASKCLQTGEISFRCLIILGLPVIAVASTSLSRTICPPVYSERTPGVPTRNVVNLAAASSGNRLLGGLRFFKTFFQGLRRRICRSVLVPS